MPSSPFSPGDNYQRIDGGLNPVGAMSDLMSKHMLLSSTVFSLRVQDTSTGQKARQEPSRRCLSNGGSVTCHAGAIPLRVLSQFAGTESRHK